MSQESRFRVNSPEVIAEVIDDEAVIVNLDSGAYYSLAGVGGRIWLMIEQGLSQSEIGESLLTQYDGEPAVIRNGLDQLIGELQAEELISVVAGDAGHTAGDAPVAAMPDAEVRGAFQAPVLNKFTDMADLLLLDPIHEVDEVGWPQPAPESGQ